MINFEKSIRTLYLKDLSGQNLTHAEKALLVVAKVSVGIVGDPVRTFSLRAQWPKTVFKVALHPSYVLSAIDEGWIKRETSGFVSLTDDGLQHINGLLTAEESNPLADTTQLLVFSPKQAHDFDKFLRQALASAKSHVRIADSYVDETIFDTVLHVIDPSVNIDLMFNHDSGTPFHAQAKRFKIQFPKFSYAKYPKLHDRYIIVDDIGFVIGPSLKDATVNSPAILVRVGSDQSTKLITLFDNIYAHRTKIT